ncbi:MAG: cell wall-binding repeat-containing protein, partial [Coriobacteriales bacterium]|nr:cell wall-binding repeat-containing protein [Coriobacteriales bacterium]
VTSRIEGGSGTLSYRWYKSPTGSFLGAEVIEGVSGASFTPPSDTTGLSYYFCEVTGTLETAGTVRAITRAASVEVVALAPVDLSGFSVTGIDPLGYVYTGVAITAPVTVTDPATSLALRPDEDYTLAYSPNVSVGEVRITIIGKDAYTGKLETSFLIRKAPLILTLASKEKVYGAGDPAFTYAVSGLRAGDELTGLSCSRTAGEDRGDYAITAKDAVIAREGVEVTANYDIAYAAATLTITPRGLFEGGFVITGIEEKGYSYTGSALTPAVTVTNGTTILKSASDYTLSYHANTEPGTASLAVTGKGNYRGELRAGFTILTPGGPTLPEKSPWPRLDGGKTDGGRYDTMQAIVNEGWEDTGSPYVIVASGANFPDALAASSLAGIYGSPVILTETEGLSVQAQETIEALGADKAFIIGGEAAVAPQTMEALEVLVGEGKVERIAGDTRIATALAIYEEGKTPEGGLPSWSETAIIANGFSFADALSISPFANATRSPLFLSTPGTGPESGLDEATLAAITTGGFKKLIITGGVAAVPEVVEAQLASTGASIERWSGESRYETSVDIVERSLANSNGTLTLNNLVCATGTNYPDALAGGAFAGHAGTVLLLVHATENGGLAGLGLISKHRDEIGRGYVLGGAAAVPQELLTLLEEGAS